MNRRLQGVAIGVLALATASAGCGGGDSTALTKAQFTAQANAICAKAAKEKAADLEVALNKPTPSGGAKLKALEEKLVVTVALPPIDSMTERLAELEAPDGEEEKVDAIVEEFEQAVEKVEADPAIALSSDQFVKAGKMASNYGLDSCNQF